VRVNLPMKIGSGWLSLMLVVLPPVFDHVCVANKSDAVATMFDN
jgi:hypothetical protein